MYGFEQLESRLLMTRRPRVVEPPEIGQAAIVDDRMCEISQAVWNIGGAIRNSGQGFEWINDATHSPLNVGPVINNYWSIVIPYDNSASKVVTVSITPDEQFSKLGVTAGASVGTSKMTVWFSYGDGKIIPINQLTQKFANFWVFGVFQ